MRVWKENKLLFCIGFLFLLLIGSTVTYFQAESQMANKFYTAEAKIYLNEKFNPNDQWLPGEEKQKEVRFGNEGDVAAVLRIRFQKTLTGRDGISEAVTNKIQLNFTEKFLTEWEQHGDWYYYKKVLEPEQLTDVTLRSVTISNELGNDEHGILKDYSGAVFDVQIKGELLQASLAEEAAGWQNWEWIPELSGNQITWKQRN